jgi:hypothetical protein
VVGDKKSILKLLLDSFESLTKIVDSNCNNLQPWKIILYTSSASLAAVYLYNYYNDIDTGISIY